MVSLYVPVSLGCCLLPGVRLLLTLSLFLLLLLLLCDVYVYTSRLVSALSSLNVSSSSQGSAPAPMLKHFSHISTNTGSTGNAGGKTAAAATTSAGGGFTNLNRGAISPTRILGAALKIYAGYVKQVISGVEASFSTLSLPSELIAAFNEVDAFIAHAVHPVRTVSPIVISLTSSHKIENKSFDAVAGSILVNPLREPFHRDALQEVYELYNAMEFIIRKESASLQAAAVTAGQAAAVSAAGAGTFHHTRVPFGGGIAAGKANVSIHPTDILWVLLSFTYQFIGYNCLTSPMYCTYCTTAALELPVTRQPLLRVHEHSAGALEGGECSGCILI